MSDSDSTTHAPVWRLRRQYLHVFAAAACVVPFLSYVLTDLHWSPSEIGFATTLAAVSGIVTAPAWGWLDDEWPGAAPRVALFTTAAAAMSMAAAVRTPQHWLMLVAVALFGGASGSLEGLLTTGAMRGKHTDKIGAVRAAGSAGWVLGLILGATAITFVKAEPAWIFVVAAVAAITAPRPRGRGERRAKDAPRASWPLREVLWVLSFTLPIPISVGTLVQFSAGWAHRDLNAGPYASIAPIALSALLELPAFVAVDRFARGRSSILVITAALPLVSGALGLLAIFPGRLTLILVQPLVATAFALWFVGQSRLTSEHVALDRLASAQTLVAVLSRGLAAPIIGIGGGALATAAGYPTLFATVSGIAALGAVRGLIGLRAEQRRDADLGYPRNTSDSRAVVEA